MTKPLTLEDFLQQPETEPASEYIDGLVIQKPMLQGEHSAIQTELAPAINQVVKPAQVARAFTELRCPTLRETILRMSIVADPSFPIPASYS